MRDVIALTTEGMCFWVLCFLEFSNISVLDSSIVFKCPESKMFVGLEYSCSWIGPTGTSLSQVESFFYYPPS